MRTQYTTKSKLLEVTPINGTVVTLQVVTDREMHCSKCPKFSMWTHKPDTKLKCWKEMFGSCHRHIRYNVLFQKCVMMIQTPVVQIIIKYLKDKYNWVTMSKLNNDRTIIIWSWIKLDWTRENKEKQWKFCQQNVNLLDLEPLWHPSSLSLLTNTIKRNYVMFSCPSWISVFKKRRE